MLTCRELNQIATAYLEGQLPWTTRMGIRMHLMMCSHCRRYLRQLREIRDASGALPPLDMPDDVAQSLSTIFARAHAEQSDAGAPDTEPEHS